MNPPLNATFLALIPKYDNPNSLNEFQPISLCNITYKVMTKIIARRLKKVFSKVISQEQFGFLEGKIHESIGVAQEDLHTQKTTKRRGTTLKIDLSKAFDGVN